jgi:hypothetical protein
MAVANDGAGAVGADSVRVTVVASAEDLPPRAAQLMAAPDDLYLCPGCGSPTGSIFVHNIGNLDIINWQATASERWVQLSKTRGETPDTIEVSVDTRSLAVGTHRAAITITNSRVPAQQEVVELYVTIKATPRVWFPVILK